MAESRTCAHCGDPFKPYRPWQIYCPGGQCRKDAWNDSHPRVRRRSRPRASPIVRAMTAALMSLRGEP